MQACAYICGFIIKNMNINNCKVCKKIFLTDPNTESCFVKESLNDFNNSGPVFLMIGGQGTASLKWMVNGYWIDPKTFKALCFPLEHRHYGVSHPKNQKMKIEMVKVMKIVIISDLLNTRIIIEIWNRITKSKRTEYFKVVINALDEKTGDSNCVSELKRAHQQIEEKMKIDPVTIEKDFKVCKPFRKATENDIKNFYNPIADDFADLVQYNEDNRMSADLKYKNITINTVIMYYSFFKEIKRYREK